jgi:hypothetical protein
VDNGDMEFADVEVEELTPSAALVTFFCFGTLGCMTG